MNNDSLKHAIEAHFIELLNTHMAKSPMLNIALRVELIGFSAYKDKQLAVVITPWFMGLFLIPQNDLSANNIKDGTVSSHSFANGDFAFTKATDAAIGHYETCTLFTSMADFTSQSQARDVARETLRLLLGTAAPRKTNTLGTRKALNRRELFLSAIRRSKNN